MTRKLDCIKVCHPILHQIKWNWNGMSCAFMYKKTTKIIFLYASSNEHTLKTSMCLFFPKKHIKMNIFSGSDCSSKIPVSHRQCITKYDVLRNTALKFPNNNRLSQTFYQGKLVFVMQNDSNLGSVKSTISSSDDCQLPA